MDKNFIRSDAVEKLIQAIVVRAANDYRDIFRRRLYGKPISKNLENEFDELEGFFESKWFSFLTNMDGDYIIEKLHQDERRKKRQKLKYKKKV